MTVRQAWSFDAFMDGATEGWSLAAIRAPISDLSVALRRRADVLDYHVNVGAKTLSGHPIIYVETEKRRSCVLQMEGSPWSVVLRTVDWIEPKDAVAIRRMAADLSQEMGVTALASIGAYSGAECRMFVDGDETIRVDTDDPHQEFLEFCEQQELGLPGCFIGFDGKRTTLYLQDVPLEIVHRVDGLVLKARG